jgi:anti-sigma B factor antagonist
MTTSQNTERIHALDGRYDALRASELDDQLQDLLDTDAQTIVLDLRDVTYVSSSALRVLLLAHRQAASEGSRIVLINIPERVMRVLSMAGLDRVFGIRTT